MRRIALLRTAIESPAKTIFLISSIDDGQGVGPIETHMDPLIHDSP